MPASLPIAQFQSCPAQTAAEAVMPSACRITHSETEREPAMPHACETCGRTQGDLWIDPCAYCRPDANEPLRCWKCRTRSVRCSFGLCRKCYQSTPAGQRAAMRKWKRQQPLPKIPNSTAEPVLPASPTSALPGSPEKLRIMVERLRNGQSMHHPDDALAVPRDLLMAFTEMCLHRDAGGVSWNPDLQKWRARPWWTLGPKQYRRFHLGYFLKQECAIVAVRRWRKMAAEIGPQQAMHEIRRERYSTSA